jgi:hypothetical protein
MQLFQEANELVQKVQRSGSWEKHARDFEQAIESVYAQNNWNNDTEQFMKRLNVDTVKIPMWDVDKRMRHATDMIRERYGLNDEQVKKAQSLYVRNALAFFIKHGETIVPLAREIIETRLENRPYTPEMVAKWAKSLRPIAEEWMRTTNTELGKFAAENLTPEQRQKLEKDMAVMSQHAGETLRDAARWERGEWQPSMWGLDKDPIHAPLQAELEKRSGRAVMAGHRAPSEAGQPSSPTAPPPGPPPPRVARGPVRLGDQPAGGVQVTPRQPSAPLPDEDQWVAYVRQFITRYALDESQKSSAFAVLKDMQERAQNYRGSHSEEIKRLEESLKQAKSPEERNSIQSELREALKGIDQLFEELKTRLQSIPTAEQNQRAGS